MRSVNDDIAAVAAGFERGAPAGLTWGFACECGDPQCMEWVQLDLPGYEAIRAEDHGTVLADGHAARSHAERTRRLARELRSDAAALRGEARHQASRARRLQVTRDYRYELLHGERTIATGHLGSVEPLEVGDAIELAGLLGTVESVEPLSGEHELRLVLQIRENE